MERKANTCTNFGSLTASQYSEAVRLADWRLREQRQDRDRRDYEDDPRERLRRFGGR